MNVFRIEIRPAESLARGRGETRMFIDDRPLLELVQEVERPFVTTEEPGGYYLPPPEVVLAPSEHLLGVPGDDGSGDESRRQGKVVIGGCGGCGTIGCWPLLVRIDVLDDRVIWSDFENPFRGQESVLPGDPENEIWDWSGLGPYVFNRKRYQHQLNSPAVV